MKCFIFRINLVFSRMVFSSIVFSLIFSVLVSFNLFAQQQLAQQETIATPSQVSLPITQQFDQAELAQILAPIALYPDSLLTHILIASTYPIEIIEAHRWLKKNEGLNAKEITQLVQEFDWDASVKALVAFEKILGRLSEDLTWTQQLGDAFLQDEAKVLVSIQTLRKQAERAGNLEKMANMAVSYEDNNIVIEPVEKEIIYVPYYDTRMVYGAWHWSAYPPVYWPPHHSVYVSHYSPFYWHSGIHISFNYFFSAFHWNNRQVVVVNPHRSRYYRGRHQITHGGYAKQWAHQPTHRKGVAYRSKHVSQKYHSNRVRVHQGNRQAHSAQRINTERHFKQSLAIKKHSVNNNHSRKAPSKNSVHSRPVSKPYVVKQYVASVKSTSLRKNTGHQQNVNSTKVAVKNHSKSARAHSTTSTRNKGSHANTNQHRQSQQSKPMKSHHSPAVKSRHK